MSALRTIARHLVLSGGGMLPFPRRHSEVRFFYGHTLAERHVPDFRRMLGMLRRHYEFVSMRDAASLVRMPDAPAGRYVALSFDDGFRSNYEYIAPVLDEFGARACFFVATGFIDCGEANLLTFLRERLRAPDDQLPMTWRMLGELRGAGFEIGAHTVDHVDLARVSLSEATSQIAASQDALTERLGVPCELFAWPFGTATNFPPALLPFVQARFDEVFSAIRSRSTFSYGGAVINRDHFEPGWPLLHVRYFMRRRIASGGGAEEGQRAEAVHGWRESCTARRG